MKYYFFLNYIIIYKKLLNNFFKKNVCIFFILKIKLFKTKSFFLK